MSDIERRGKRAEELVAEYLRNNGYIIAKMNYRTMTLNPNVENMQQELLDKHYLRKHGVNAYYGQ